MVDAAPAWTVVAASLFYMAGAIASVVAVAWIYRHGDTQRPDRSAVLGALALTGAWCIVSASYGMSSFPASIAEAGRNLAWLVVLLRLFANDGRDESLPPIRPVVVALAMTVCLQPMLAFVTLHFEITARGSALAMQISALLHMLVSIGALVLVHNLYVGASAPSRQILRWTAAALAVLWAFDLNFYTIAYLGSGISPEIGAVRGLVAVLMAAPVALGAQASSAGMTFRPSRTVTFQSLSLIVIGAYLLGMIAIARTLSLFVGDISRLTQIGFVVAATTLALLWLPSKRLRGWLRVTAAKHFFQHRYDYRAEWLRFNATIGNGGSGSSSLQERAVQAVADITDCPSGLLLVPTEDGTLELAARWNWTSLEVPSMAMSEELACWIERTGYIIDLDEVRQGIDRQGEAGLVPEWLKNDHGAWALVPVAHFDRLVGVVVLSRPAIPRSLDWEDFDLLRVVGQQLASYLAEHSGQQALMEASRFDEFNRRIAFVMHDIKNLSSQMTLLLRNAEKHADKPEFRADMLVTLRNSADKLNNLLLRLGRYGSDSVGKREPIDLERLVQRVAGQYKKVHPVSVVTLDTCEVSGDPEAVEQAVTHLVQNAIDASEENSPVFIEISNDGVLGRIDVIDSGTGMSPQFIRSGLFKPFVSSKSGGFGIGAFEAREMVRAMGGRLEVESREGLGSRFTICLPLSATAGFLSLSDANLSEVA